MDKAAVFHLVEGSYAYAAGSDAISVRLRLKTGDCDGVTVRFNDVYDHSEEYDTQEMRRILSDGVVDLFEATIRVAKRRFKYYFEIRALGSTHFYTGDGFLARVDEKNCFYYPVVNTDEIPALPAWAEGNTIYQIVVDRFFNGDRSNDPPKTKGWEELPDRQTFYGGDFQGIVQKLDYLAELGIGMLYLCPVFQSPTYHKYDVLDYYRIEDHFGGREALAEFVRQAHSRGIRVILDAVFNHCSSQNEIFQDVVRNGERSKYSKWFFIESYPVDTKLGNYDSFAGLVPEMPRFDTSNPEVIEYLTDSALYWTRELDIDGWRLDVSDEVSPSFWRAFRRKLKEYKRDLLIIGEAWHQAGRWMQGDEFDTMTHYAFWRRLMAFADGRIAAEDFWNGLGASMMLYKTPFHNYLVNMAGSHDTIRCATFLGDKGLSRLALAAVLTMQGIPLIYYGDEIGMQGDDDPDNRRAMQWDHIDAQMLALVKALVHLRAGNGALRAGGMEPLLLGGRVLAFRRTLGSESVTVVLNFGDTAVCVPGEYRDVLFGSTVIEEGAFYVHPLESVVAR